jgi:hypothetical protein
MAAIRIHLVNIAPFAVGSILLPIHSRRVM